MDCRGHMTPDHETKGREQQQVEPITEQDKHPGLEHHRNAHDDSADNNVFQNFIGSVGYSKVEFIRQEPNKRHEKQDDRRKDQYEWNAIEQRILG